MVKPPSHLMPTQWYTVNSRFNYLGLDVTVSFGGNAAGRAGHVGLGVNTPNTVGQRPQDGASTLAIVAGRDVPGEISPDPATPNNIVIRTTPQQDSQIQQCIDTRILQQQDYNLYDNNCSLFVQQCLNAAEINTSGTIFPRVLYRELGGTP